MDGGKGGGSEGHDSHGEGSVSGDTGESSKDDTVSEARRMTKEDEELCLIHI